MKVNGKQVPLYFSVWALLEIEKKYGGISEAMERLQTTTEDNVETVVYLANLFAKEAARLDAYLSDPDAANPPEISDYKLLIKPAQFAVIRSAVMQAITEGMRQSEADGEQEEIDVGLAELQKTQKKRKTAN